MTLRQKKNKIKKINNIELLKLYAEYTVKFNPIDDDFIESYEVITGEVLRRMKEGNNE